MNVMKKHLAILYIFIAVVFFGCGKDEDPLPEPTVVLESGASSIVESSFYEGEPGETIAFTANATALAGLESFYIELEQRNSAGSSNERFILIEKGDPNIVDNTVEYTFSIELLESHFAYSDNLFRAVVTDSKGRKAIRGFRLERKR